MLFINKIHSNDDGKILLTYLSERYTYYSPNEWKNEILEKKVLVNQTYVTENYILNQNDVLSFQMEEFQEPEVDENYSIVFEDDFYFAINKPGNLPVHPAGRYRKNNLTSLLSKYGFNSNQFFLINRIDRETSGIVIFGKTSEAAGKLGKLFEQGKIKKTYISYVEGVFPDKVEAKGYLSKDESSNIRKKKKFSFHKSENSLWEINTNYELIEIKNNISKVFAFPFTGKIHQIRATLYSLGYPVVGDKIYGYDENIFLEFIETGIVKSKYEIQRQALHAYSLDFTHPFLQKQIQILAPEPEDMKKILN